MERWYPPQERVNVSGAGGEGGILIVYPLEDGRTQNCAYY